MRRLLPAVLLTIGCLPQVQVERESGGAAQTLLLIDIEESVMSAAQSDEYAALSVAEGRNLQLFEYDFDRNELGLPKAGPIVEPPAPDCTDEDRPMRALPATDEFSCFRMEAGALRKRNDCELTDRLIPAFRYQDCISRDRCLTDDPIPLCTACPETPDIWTDLPELEPFEQTDVINSDKCRIVQTTRLERRDLEQEDCVRLEVSCLPTGLPDLADWSDTICVGGLDPRCEETSVSLADALSGGRSRIVLGPGVFSAAPIAVNRDVTILSCTDGLLDHRFQVGTATLTLVFGQYAVAPELGPQAHLVLDRVFMRTGLTVPAEASAEVRGSALLVDGPAIEVQGALQVDRSHLASGTAAPAIHCAGGTVVTDKMVIHGMSIDTEDCNARLTDTEIAAVDPMGQAMLLLGGEVQIHGLTIFTEGGARGVVVGGDAVVTATDTTIATNTVLVGEPLEVTELTALQVEASATLDLVEARVFGARAAIINSGLLTVDGIFAADVGTFLFSDAGSSHLTRAELVRQRCVAFDIRGANLEVRDSRFNGQQEDTVCAREPSLILWAQGGQATLTNVKGSNLSGGAVSASLGANVSVQRADLTWVDPIEAEVAMRIAGATLDLEDVLLTDMLTAFALDPAPDVSRLRGLRVQAVGDNSTAYRASAGTLFDVDAFYPSLRVARLVQAGGCDPDLPHRLLRNAWYDLQRDPVAVTFE